MEIWERILEKKKQLDELRPLPKTLLNKLKEQVIVEWTYNTNAIEGNTLTLRETQLVLEEGLTIAGKSLREHFEVTNHKEAILWLEDLISKKKKITEKDLKKLNEIVLNNIEKELKGEYRKQNVRILGARHFPPSHSKISKLMKDFLNWLWKKPEKLNILEQAALAHYKLVAIHPWIDGNGRVARLLMNFILIKKGFPPAIILKTDRPKYYRVLNQANLGNLKPFVLFIAQATERTLNLYLNAFKKTTPEEEFISLKEATKYCPYSQEYLSLLARRGKLDVFKLNRNWVTSKKAILEYLKSQKKKSRKKAKPVMAWLENG